MKVQIARNNGRFYRVSMMQMRYFPMKRAEAEHMLATEQAIEVAYTPFSRGDLINAHCKALAAIQRAAQ